MNIATHKQRRNSVEEAGGKFKALRQICFDFAYIFYNHLQATVNPCIQNKVLKIHKYHVNQLKLSVVRAISDPFEHLVTSTSILLCFATLKTFLSGEFSAGFDSVLVYGDVLRA